MYSYSSSSTPIKMQKESDNPIDSVQCIVWDSYESNTFYTGGWDGVARIYRIQGNSSRQIYLKWEYFFQHPIITMEVTKNQLMFVGLATGQIGLVNIKNTKEVAMIGQHDTAICKIIWIENYQILLSFGFDNKIKVFSLQNVQNGNFQIQQYKLPYKTQTVAFYDPFILIGSQEGKCAILYYDKLNNTNFEYQYQNIFDESHGIIKFSCSAIHGNKGRIIFGCSDGRIFSTGFSTNNSGIRILKPSILRTQKKLNYRKQFVGMVNCLDIAVKEGRYEFAIYGGSSQAGYLNSQKNIKIKTLSIGEASVTAISIRPDCQYFAYAIGCDWCKGLEQLSSYSPVKIAVSKLNTNDVNYNGSSSYTR